MPPRSIPNSAGKFNELDNALTELGLQENRRNEIYRHLAALLHLGNIDFENNDDNKSFITSDTYSSLEYAANLLSIDVVELKNVFLERKYTIPNKEEDMYEFQYFRTSFTLNVPC